MSIFNNIYKYMNYINVIANDHKLFINNKELLHSSNYLSFHYNENNVFALTTSHIIKYNSKGEIVKIIDNFYDFNSMMLNNDNLVIKNNKYIAIYSLELDNKKLCLYSTTRV